MNKLSVLISKRMNFTFFFSLIATVVVHLFMLVNNWKNHDSLWHFYGDMNLSSSGRFSLKYLGGFSSYFDLHYLNLLISCFFLSLGITLLVEIFNISNKKYIVLFAIIYASFPSVSGIFSYAFTADAYFISFSLTILSIYICSKSKWYTLLGIFLFYLALGTYQANLTLAISIVALLLIQKLLNGNDRSIKDFITYIITVSLGLILYAIHFKIYQYKVGLTSYGGIDEAGVINLETLKLASEKAVSSFNSFIFNNFSFVNLFEKLNLFYLILIGILLILLLVYSKINYRSLIGIVILIAVAPYYLYLIYFISPNVFYHVLMLQNIPLIFLIGIFIFDNFNLDNTIFKVLKKVTFITLSLIAFNLVIITNIYYEKLSLVNNYTDSMMTKVSYRIETLDEFPTIDSLLVIGNPTTHLNFIEGFNSKVPYNVGTNNIAFNGYTATIYLNNFLGHNLTTIDEQSDFAKNNENEFKEMSIWPTANSVKVIDNTVIIRFE